MEKDKKYNLVLGLMIFFFILFVGVCVAWGLGFIGLKTNTDSTNPNNENAVNNDITEDTNVQEKPQIDYKNIVSNGIVERKDVGICCEFDNVMQYYNITLPKINLQTDIATKLNQEFNKKYDEIIKAYSGGNKRMLGSTDITYNWSYVNKLDMLYISVTDWLRTGHATGGLTQIDYFYDMKNEKLLSKSEFLEKVNVSVDSIEQKFKENYNSYESDRPDTFIDSSLENLYVSSISENKIIFKTWSISYTVTAEFNY